MFIQSMTWPLVMPCYTVGPSGSEYAGLQVIMFFYHVYYE